MQISIKKIDGTREDFNVESSDKVSKLKEILAEKSGISKEQIRLIYKGQPMKDNQTLEESKVSGGDTLHMILQMRAGAF